ncbi:hypothetical protein B9479_001210 [Cryptococcus floricola]|uniref:Alpha-galactosidase n=1 Tax=Cryptococcus floricola TaxID=2591691 RepID=A0A5D3B5J6_9TREE|nr:hypothetical protein B9479_001210 [Cryptococcus floricola]
MVPLLSSGVRIVLALSAISLIPSFTLAASPIQVDGLNFTLSGPSVSYQFHVNDDGDLIHDYFGAFAADPIRDLTEPGNGWRSPLAQHRREFPDQGRGDFRLPAFHIRHDSGSTVSQFVYEGHDIIEGKPALDGLPATWGNASDVSTLQVYLVDQQSSLTATLSYSIFPDIGAITRSFKLKNEGEANVTLERAMSWSLDLPPDDWEMVQLSGDWASEGRAMRRPVYTGVQGFQSSAGYSSHFHNPFLALVHPDTTETTGSAYGFNLIYTGSHTTEVEKFTPGFTRVLMGLNPLHLSWVLSPEETFTTPECVAVYSEEGLGGMSRAFHRLYREHLIRSKWVDQTRPVLINSWEAFGFDFTETDLEGLAETAKDLGVELFVLDDGWFGNTYPRTSDEQGLGDWQYNTERFPQGLEPLVDNITSLTTARGEAMKFGIWVEPEMVNPRSSLYDAHPDWVLSSSSYNRTETRNQLVLDVGRPEVQQYIIDFMTDLLSNASISYVKWDNNRGMHELPQPSSAHSYILGLYHVIDTLTGRFPDILWEGCASGGGRFDPGLMYYWPQTWTSDDTDAYQRLFIQFGTSIPYPPSTQGAHVSAVPNGQLERTTPLEFRAHVAMMGGSFGFELDLGNMTEGEKGQAKELVEVAEKVNPLVISGDMYKLALPETSNWPAALYVSKDKSEAVLLAYQVRSTVMTVIPALKLQGLEEDATYNVNGTTYQGSSLIKAGLKLGWEKGDYLSKVVWITKE